MYNFISKSIFWGETPHTPLGGNPPHPLWGKYRMVWGYEIEYELGYQLGYQLGFVGGVGVWGFNPHGYGIKS